MKTKEYIKKFNLDIQDAKFDKEGLLKSLSKELESLITERVSQKEGTGLEFTYTHFQNMIKQINTKFWAISNKRNGQAFTYEYWGAFYSLYVVPLRALHFPEVHSQIESKRREEMI